jgi:hypothetical protein
MKSRTCGIIIIFFIALYLILVSGCTGSSGTTQTVTVNASQPDSTVEKVEVYHFHATRQCYSCITLGAYAEETVSTYFAPEVASGKVVFAHVNIELPENKDLIERYGPTGSSLWIGVYDQNGFHKEENVNVWYKIGDKDDYESYLKGIIARRLAGDFS